MLVVALIGLTCEAKMQGGELINFLWDWEETNKCINYSDSDAVTLELNELVGEVIVRLDESLPWRELTFAIAYPAEYKMSLGLWIEEMDGGDKLHFSKKFPDLKYNVRKFNKAVFLHSGLLYTL